MCLLELPLPLPLLLGQPLARGGDLARVRVRVRIRLGVGLTGHVRVRLARGGDVTRGEQPAALRLDAHGRLLPTQRRLRSTTSRTAAATAAAAAAAAAVAADAGHRRAAVHPRHACLATPPHARPALRRLHTRRRVCLHARIHLPRARALAPARDRLVLVPGKG